MRVMKFSILAAGLIGGAAMLSGGSSASAATLAPAIAQTPDRAAAVQEVRHDWAHRSGRVQGKRYWRPKNAPGYRYGRRDFRRSGPVVGFGLSAPGFSFSFGSPSYGYSPYGYSYGAPYGYRRGW